VKCPFCKKDFRETVILNGAAAIVARRRKKAGNQMTSEQARERQLLSAQARAVNRQAKQ